MKNIFSFFKNIKDYKFFTLVLATLGLLVSGYLWYGYAQPENLICEISECQVVRQSEYSVFLGVSLPVWGFVFYLSLLIYTTAIFLKKREYIRFEFEQNIVFFVITLGFAFSLYLTYLEAFVILAWCQWCVASFVITMLLFMLNFSKLLRTKVKN